MIYKIGGAQTPDLNLDQLSDVSASSPADGDTLVYDDATDSWVSQPASGGTDLASTSQLYSTGSAETFHRLFGVWTSRGPTTGVAYLTALTPNDTITISKIGVFCVALGSGLTIARLGLYTFDGTTHTLVARTADFKSGLNVNNAFVEAPLSTVGGYPATYTLTKDVLYYVGLIEVGTTPATVGAPATLSSVAGVANFLNGTFPKLARSIAGQTDLAATYADSAMNNSVIMPYSRLS
jgi:hypothetical protein